MTEPDGVTPAGFPQRDPTFTSYANFITVAVSSIWIWDALLSIPGEIRMLRRYRSVNLPDWIYILSRVTSGGNLIAGAILAIAAFDCDGLTQSSDWLAAISLPCNSLLFLLRIRGVFHESRITIFIFIILWISTFGAFTLPFAIHSANLRGFKLLCADEFRVISSVGPLAVCVFDTLVFVAISVQVIHLGTAKTLKEQIRCFVSGNDMGCVSRMLLKTGQLYYLVSIGVTLTCTIVMFIPSINPVIRRTMAFPSLAIQNIMACRVFRLLRKGVLDEQPPLLQTSQILPSSYPLRSAPIPPIPDTPDVVTPSLMLQHGSFPINDPPTRASDLSDTKPEG